MKRTLFSICMLLFVSALFTGCAQFAEIRSPQGDTRTLASPYIPEDGVAAASDSQANEDGEFEGETETAEPSISVTFAGDVLLDRGVKMRYAERGFDGVFSDEAGFVGASDITMVNLELPFSTRGTPMPDKQWTFRGDPAHIGFLNELGADIVTVANNHALDYGRDAFLDTLELLTENNIQYAGGGKDYAEASSYRVLEANGKKIAFLAASAVLPSVEWYATERRPGLFATYNPAALNEKIAQAALAADYVVVYVHWGVEKDSMPSEWQRQTARGYIDAGASCVIGSHPHVLQGFEYYSGRPIVYSLGNFIFTDGNKDTMAVTVTLGDEITLSAAPYMIKNLKTVPAAESADRDRILRHLRDISFGVYIDDEFMVTPL